jgi:LEA14-like dessication related protein
MRSALAALAAGALLASCALAPRFTTPELTVVGLQLEGGDLFTQRLKVRVHVRNPNDRRLPIKGLEYALDVDGQPFATGESAASFEVPALGEAEFDMNVTTHVAGALMRLLARAPGTTVDTVPYRLSGKISLSEGWLQSIPFEQHGTLKLQ